jgi:hypothetical protein
MNDVTKLPRWAQTYIRNLEERVEAHEQAARQQTAEVRIVVSPLGGYAEAIGIPGARMRFTTRPMEHKYDFEVAYTIRNNERVLMLRAYDSLELRPVSGNVAEAISKGWHS